MQTTDEKLQNDVFAEFEADPQVDADRIFVDVDGSIVKLTGTVSNLNQKCAAEEAARRVKGVAGVVELITVEFPPIEQCDDIDIARAIATQINPDPAVPPSLQVTVSGGNVVLTGIVDWQFERDQAAATARTVAGVRGVTNLITLRNTVAQQDIETEILRIFHRIADVDANRVRVHCDGTAVTLSGTVRSSAEREQAAQAAWAVKGVTTVDNQIAISPIVGD